MKKVNEILKNHQSDSLEFKVNSNESSTYDNKIKTSLAKPHISNHYYFYYVFEGNTTHKIDLDEYHLSKGQLIFVCPNQVHSHQRGTSKNSYYELFFKENKQFLLKDHLPLLLNTLNKNIIDIPLDTQERINIIFKTLLQFQKSSNDDKKLQRFYLNTLLAEFNHIYLSQNNSLSKNNTLDKETLIAFKTYLNEHLLEHPSVDEIAVELGVSSNYLYKLVKEYTGKSPKEYINCLLVSEIKRHLFYGKVSTKELSYKLGFSDPSYFSKFFKKQVGKNIKLFLEDLYI